MSPDQRKNVERPNLPNLPGESRFVEYGCLVTRQVARQDYRNGRTESRGLLEINTLRAIQSLDLWTRGGSITPAVI